MEINNSGEKWAIVIYKDSEDCLKQMFRRVEYTGGWKNDITKIDEDKLVNLKIASNKKLYGYLGANKKESEYLAIAKVCGLLDDHSDVCKQEKVSAILNEPIANIREVLESGVSKTLHV